MKITKFAIFINGENDKKEIAEMILLLTKNRVQRNQIRIYDVSGEEQIQLYFKQNKCQYPVFFLWGNLYGSLNYMKEQASQGYLQIALLNNPNKKGKKGKKNNQTDYEFNPVVKEEQSQPQDEVIVEEKKEEIVVIEQPQEVVKRVEEKEIEKKEETKKENEEIQKLEESFEESLIRITESMIDESKENEEVIQEMKEVKEEQKEEKQEGNEMIVDIKDEEIVNENIKEMIIIEDYDNSQQIQQEQYYELNVPQTDTLNLNDRWLNACEWVLRTLNPMKPNSKEEDPTYLQKTEEDIDYYVTRTNWYWRHQIRIIRLSKDCFYRLDEDSKIREKFNYEDVSEIIQTDFDHVVIKFAKNSQPQYLQCKLCSQLISSLISHINGNNYKLTILN